MHAVHIVVSWELDVEICGVTWLYILAWRFPTPKKPQCAPNAWITPTYGQKVQHTLPPDTLPVLDKKGTKRFQSITGTFQYYTKGIDTTRIVAVNELAPQQVAPTQETVKKCNIRTYLPQCNNPISRKLHVSTYRL